MVLRGDDSGSPDTQMRLLLQLTAQVVHACGGEPSAYFTPTFSAASCGQLPESPPRTLDSEIPLELFPELLTRWHLDPDFINELGNPIDLPIRGPISLQALAEREGAWVDIDELKQALLQYEFAIEPRPGYLRVLARVATGAREFRMLYGLRLATHALQTLLHNINSDVTADRWFARAVRGAVPESRVSEYRQFLESQGMAFLSSIDDWLASVGKLGNGPLRPTHVHVLLTLGNGVDKSES